MWLFDAIHWNVKEVDHFIISDRYYLSNCYQHHAREQRGDIHTEGAGASSALSYFENSSLMISSAVSTHFFSHPCCWKYWSLSWGWRTNRSCQLDNHNKRRRIKTHSWQCGRCTTSPSWRNICQ
jgi:hypothetical protein